MGNLIDQGENANLRVLSKEPKVHAVEIADTSNCLHTTLVIHNVDHSGMEDPNVLGGPGMQNTEVSNTALTKDLNKQLVENNPTIQDAGLVIKLIIL